MKKNTQRTLLALAALSVLASTAAVGYYWLKDTATPPKPAPRPLAQKIDLKPLSENTASQNGMVSLTQDLPDGYKLHVRFGIDGQGPEAKYNGKGLSMFENPYTKETSIVVVDQTKGLTVGIQPLPTFTPPTPKTAEKTAEQPPVKKVRVHVIDDKNVMRTYTCTQSILFGPVKNCEKDPSLGETRSGEIQTGIGITAANIQDVATTFTKEVFIPQKRPSLDGKKQDALFDTLFASVPQYKKFKFIEKVYPRRNDGWFASLRGWMMSFAPKENT